MTRKARLALEQLYLSSQPLTTKELAAGLSTYQLPARPTLLQVLGELVAAGLVAQAGEKIESVVPIGLLGDISGLRMPLWGVADLERVRALLSPPLPGNRSRLSPLAA